MLSDQLIRSSIICIAARARPSLQVAPQFSPTFSHRHRQHHPEFSFNLLHHQWFLDEKKNGSLEATETHEFLAGSRPIKALTGLNSIWAMKGAADDAVAESCWANLPPELLREVLARIEDEGSAWPARRHVVACAGVCRSWRENMKVVVKVPEVSGRLTFPISVKQPGPRDSLLQCFIRRNRTTQTYHLYLGLSEALTDCGKFLLAARRFRRPTYTDFLISLDANNMSKGSGTYIGKLRSNFLSTKFTVHDAQPPHTESAFLKNRSTRLMGSRQVSPRVTVGNYPVAHIAYELNVLGSRGPRQIRCVMDSIRASTAEPRGMASTQTEFPHGSLDSFSSIPFFRSKSYSAGNFYGPSSGWKEGMLVLKNEDPRWHEQLQCWCLNFRGRVTVASVKNFQLVAAADHGPAGAEHDKVLLQFGKVGKDLFTMDYQYPISAFQAFAICLSSFDTKIACE